MSIYIIIGHFRVPKTLTFKMRPTSLVKMNLICIRMKNHFHIKGCALNLVLIQRPGGTRKWPNGQNCDKSGSILDGISLFPIRILCCKRLKESKPNLKQQH